MITLSVITMDYLEEAKKCISCGGQVDSCLIRLGSILCSFCRRATWVIVSSDH